LPDMSYNSELTIALKLPLMSFVVSRTHQNYYKKAFERYAVCVFHKLLNEEPKIYRTGYY